MTVVNEVHTTVGRRPSTMRSIGLARMAAYAVFIAAMGFTGAMILGLIP